ncbi:hypothetical protein EVAR_64123_1 [Eumeta japonica]|uniref:Uncharacterized protein n=1 Tax=Eumeta variegata TaxID=151549 RepID=A0A4C1Z7K3_EUMVA|nr:hypothetical protein EVAR_64123_1 [Eumeta japonica]
MLTIVADSDDDGHRRVLSRYHQWPLSAYQMYTPLQRDLNYVEWSVNLRKHSLGAEIVRGLGVQTVQ